MRAQTLAAAHAETGTGGVEAGLLAEPPWLEAGALAEAFQTP